MQTTGPVKVLVAGGGTGGHLYPGLALAQELQKRHNAEIMFIGTSYGIENKVLPTTPYSFKRIWMRGLQRRMSISNLIFPLRLLVSLVQCGYHISSFRPRVIIGTGGYVAGPALMMGVALGVATVIQEQNSFPGLVNRLLGSLVKQVHVTYEASLPYFKKAKSVFVSGNPVRRHLKEANKQEALKKFGLEDNRESLLVFGGSQGAGAINQCVFKSLNALMEFEYFQILWVTGLNDFETFGKPCEDFRGRVAVLPFVEDMAFAYALADIALCRAGASTLSEITLCGIPSIIVPYPFAAAGHQEFNARTMKEGGAAVVVLESSLNEKTLVSTVKDLLTHSEKRESMAQAALGLARPNATTEIVDKIEVLI